MEQKAVAAQRFIEGEVIEASSADDPDLNAAFWEFRNAIEQEANAGGKIAVFEVPVDANGMARPTSYQRAKLFTVPVGAVTIDDICDRVQREYMKPGEKMLIQLLARKDGEPGIKMNKLITLRAPATNAGPTGASGEVAQLLRIMNEQGSRDRAEQREMMERLARGAVTQTDPMDKALAIADRISAMSARAVTPVSGPNDPNNMMNQMMVMMMTAMMKNFMKGFGGEKEKTENTSWMADIVALAKPLLEAKAVSEKTALVREQRMLRHEAQAPAAQAPAAQTPASPGAESNAGTPKTPGPSTKEENEMKLIAMLTEFLPMLIDNFALKGAEPSDVSKLTMDNLPEEDIGLNDALYQMIQSEPAEFLAKLATMDPRAKDHAEWFEKYRLALLEAFDPDQRAPQGSAR
jgi:hypothetical protein